MRFVIVLLWQGLHWGSQSFPLGNMHSQELDGTTIVLTEKFIWGKLY